MGPARRKVLDTVPLEARPVTTPTEPAIAPARRGQFAQPSIAELVADAIRTQIVAGTLPDGSLLPKQDQLIDEFKVSRPSFREALRILESEGLLSVRRGNVGGAQVHAPTPANAARTLGLVLQARNVALDDLAAALDAIEPACAAHCAQRADRATTLVPRLRELNVRCSALDPQDLSGAALSFQEFHQAIVDGCGNETLVIVVGALESLWSLHKQAWADDAADAGSGPEPNLRASVIAAHEEITDAIEAGDAALAHQLVTAHLATVSPMVLDHRAPRTDTTGARS
jgi:GntR family transcriptional regulator, transcriptional repressor for pyruvate dehydrogenase complex